jgi:hypothetical protein
MIFVAVLIILILGGNYGLVRADETTPTSSLGDVSSELTSSSSLSGSDSTISTESSDPLSVVGLSTSTLDGTPPGDTSQDSGSSETVSSTTPISDILSDLDSSSSSSELTFQISATAPSSTDVTSTTEDLVPSSSPETIINSGNAFGEANVVNVVSTNIFDSQGLLSLLNLFWPLLGNIDFQNLNFPSDNCPACQAALVTNNNSSTVSNDISVIANSGSNTISNSTDSTIITGSTVASANVVNIVNTNISSSNYLFLVLNNFNSWVGDLVFPGNDFFRTLSAQSNPSSTEGGAGSTISNDNAATINNTLETTADTGGNQISGSGSSTIQTGNAIAVANNLTVANSNLTSNSQIVVMIRVFGSWTGNVFSTPPGVSWKETPNGIVLYNSGNESLFSSGLPCCDIAGEVANSNSATINNNVKAIALTGSNRIEDGSGSSLISTGNAVAVSNVMNLANTNIVGRNILLAMINIFGDWQGNLAFGRPNLWLGLRAQLPSNPVLPGTEVVYNLSVLNRGNADATRIQVRAKNSLSNFMNITDMGGGTADQDGVLWEIPSLPSGASTTLSFKTTLAASVFGLERVDANVTSLEDDADTSDNSDFLSYSIQGASGGGIAPYPILWIRETNSATAPISPDTMTDFKILVSNDSNIPVDNTSLVNVLYSPYGEIISSSSWTLGTLKPWKQLLVKYNTKFMSNASSGWYISYSWLQEEDKRLPGIVASSSIYLMNPNDSNQIIPPPREFVLPPVNLVANKTSTVGTIEVINVPKTLSRKHIRPSLAKIPKTNPVINQPAPLVVNQLSTPRTKINAPSMLASMVSTVSLDWLYKSFFPRLNKDILGALQK